MNTFTTRVELHNTNDGTSEEYVTLHQAMQEQGFTRTIRSTENVESHLPPAEYNFSGDFTKEAVLAKARIAASRTGKSHSILVTESIGRTWYNLDLV